MARLPGDPTTKSRLLRGLTRRSFPYLVADVLAARGHRNVRVVDGTGDGGRDIHSLLPNGREHVTQCKFHDSPTSTAGADETRQLLLAMLRIGAKAGVFATNARVSPQAEREFLDDFPDYAVEVLAGLDIVDAVLGDPRLRAAWFDGASVVEVAHQIVIPFVCRDLSWDAPKRLPEEITKFSIADDLRCRISADRHSASLFAPYRSAAIRTLDEPMSSIINGYSATFEGRCSLFRLDEMMDALTGWLESTASGMGSELLAFRLAGPRILSLSEHPPGQDLGYVPQTYIWSSSRTLIPEIDWILPSADGPWKVVDPYMWRASVADWIRWYHEGLDCALDIVIECAPGPALLESLKLQQDFLSAWWQRSLFALGTRECYGRLLRSLPPDNPRPTSINLHRDLVLVQWTHPNLLPGLRRLPILPRDGVPDPDDPLVVAETEADAAFATWVDQMRGILTTAEFEEIDPEAARHLAASARSGPPLFDLSVGSYRAFDLVTGFDDVPSPVSPSSRTLRFECCWVVDADAKEVDRAISESDYRGLLAVDIGGPGVVYLQAQLILDRPGGVSTDEYLEINEAAVRGRLQMLDRWVQSTWPNAKAATREYWLQEIGIPLGQPERQ